MDYKSLKVLYLALIIHYSFDKKYNYNCKIIDYFSFLLSAGSSICFVNIIFGALILSSFCLRPSAYLNHDPHTFEIGSSNNAVVLVRKIKPRTKKTVAFYRSSQLDSWLVAAGKYQTSLWVFSWSSLNGKRLCFL